MLMLELGVRIRARARVRIGMSRAGLTIRGPHTNVGRAKVFERHEAELEREPLRCMTV